MEESILVTIREIADGVRSDIFRSEESKLLLQLIGVHASSINQNGFGHFFGRLQIILQEQIVLLLSKIYEKPKNFSLKRIPAIEKLLRKQGPLLIQLESKNETSILLLKKLGCGRIPEDKNITNLFPKYWQNHFGSTKAARKKVYMFRDKIAAHHEQIDANSVPVLNLREVDKLLEQAKLFLAIIESTYLNLESVDYDGNYFATSNSKTASFILNNLLVKANVIDIRVGREIIRSLLT